MAEARSAPDASRRPAVFLVGAFPPPVHGLSKVNQAMADLLAGQARIVEFDTAVLARARSSSWHRFSQLRRVGWLVVRFAALIAVQRPSSIYIGLSGGRGQFLDGIFAMIGNALHVPVFFHHHSFRYINKSSRLTRIVFRLAGKATHIALCAHMATRLKQAYPSSVHETLVLSNAAFFPVAYRQHPRARGTLPLTLGFLSNITREKGIFAFFDVLSALESKGLQFSAIIAGPVADAIADEFNAALMHHPHARHIGPVSGEEKTKFYQAIDLLVFPSRYENEAEPLTVIEAIASGVPVIASDKGCIPSTLRNGGGAFVVDDERMVGSITELIIKIGNSPDVYECLSRRAIASVIADAPIQNATLSRLVGMLMQPAR
ncbi:MAG TPA: glycosyltransferase family 4 protein [Trinickia sp.]|nr:glycosyltransferase family 4 protein [Trinickia sp.]